MIYWIRAYSRFTKFDPKNFTVEGKFIKNNVLLSERYKLFIENATGYNQRWHVCILVKENITAIAYGYLTVEGDPDKSHYQEEKPDDEDLQLKPDRKGRNQDPLALIIAGSVSVIMVLITIIGVTVYKRQKSSNVIVKYWMKKIVVEKPLVPDSDGLLMPIVKIEKVRLTQTGIEGNDYTLMSEYQLPVDTQWEILRSRMSFTGKVLGEGEFGKVVEAECDGIVTADVKTVVAVKKLKEDHSDADVTALVSEMEIMKKIGKHENIISLLGCCTQDGPFYVIVEYASNGCLREYLKKHKPNKKNNSNENLLLNKRLTQRDLMEFSLQVAKGMEYLASRGRPVEEDREGSDRSDG
ncbi:fibroblast growth factor receptor homolog 2-like [Choristoneura fumiferana]|uniref:fibroblast growth factor receptor homolog 2-like n=1 Tax=Choristoneura fumiferana TaxID=7141 RepID=UPI003D15C0D7